MKILLVDVEYDYGIKDRGINAIGQDGFKKSFEKLSHDVIPFHYDSFLKKIDSLQEELCKFADTVKPDLIFFSLMTDQFSHQTLCYLKSKYTTINWFGDDQWRFDNFTKHYANDFTWCISTHKFSVEKYRRLGQKNIIYSQWAAIDEHKSEIHQQEYRYDVSFVGGFHPYRKWFIEQLSKQGIVVDAFGHGWPNGPLTNDEMNLIFSETKINLNISNSISLDINYLCSSFRAFINALRSKKMSSQIKARNFEIPFFGGFQLSDYVPTIEDCFVIGREITCYTSPEEAASLIEYYLINDVEREKIKQAGYKRALNEHGYIHRLEKVLEAIP